MQDQMMNSMQQMMGPVRKFNELMLNNTEKLVEFQIDRMRTYSDLGIGRMRAALEVTDSQSLQSFLTEQNKFANNLAQQVTEDMKTLNSISQSFGTEMQAVTQENVSNLQETAAKAASRKTA